MILNILHQWIARWRDAVVHLDRLSGMTVSGNFHLRLVVSKNWMRTAFKLCVVLIWLVYCVPYILLFLYICICLDFCDRFRTIYCATWSHWCRKAGLRWELESRTAQIWGLAPAFSWIFIDIPDLSRSHSHPQVPRFRSDGFNATAQSTLVALGCQRVIWDIVKYCGIRSRCSLESDTDSVTPVTIQHSPAPLLIPMSFA